MTARSVFLLLVLAAAAYGQTNTGAITGIVTDTTGSAIPAAKVAIRELTTNAMVNTVTTASGNFTAPSLPVGQYEVSVSTAGFKRARATDVEVRATQTTTQNFSLEVGDVAESVTVTSETPLMNPNSSAVTTSVGEKFLEDLPFMDRSTLSVVMLTPGAQGDPQYNGGVQSELPGIFDAGHCPRSGDFDWRGHPRRRVHAGGWIGCERAGYGTDGDDVLERPGAGSDGPGQWDSRAIRPDHVGHHQSIDALRDQSISWQRVMVTP